MTTTTSSRHAGATTLSPHATARAAWPAPGRGVHPAGKRLPADHGLLHHQRGPAQHRRLAARLRVLAGAGDRRVRRRVRDPAGPRRPPRRPIRPPPYLPRGARGLRAGLAGLRCRPECGRADRGPHRPGRHRRPAHPAGPCDLPPRARRRTQGSRCGPVRGDLRNRRRGRAVGGRSAGQRRHSRDLLAADLPGERTHRRGGAVRGGPDRARHPLAPPGRHRPARHRAVRRHPDRPAGAADRGALPGLAVVDLGDARRRGRPGRRHLRRGEAHRAARRGPTAAAVPAAPAVDVPRPCHGVRLQHRLRRVHVRLCPHRPERPARRRPAQRACDPADGPALLRRFTGRAPRDHTVRPGGAVHAAPSSNSPDLSPW